MNADCAVLVHVSRHPLYDLLAAGSKLAISPSQSNYGLQACFHVFHGFFFFFFFFQTYLGEFIIRFLH